MRFLSVVTFAAVVGIAGSACNTTQSVQPSGSIRVDSITPTLPQPLDGPQTIRVQGVGFRSGSIGIDLTDPMGVPVVVNPSDMVNVTSTTFDWNVTLNLNGTYLAVVRDTITSDFSTPFLIPVGASGDQPQITSISPSSVRHSALFVTVSVTGSKLDAADSVQVIDPQGFTTQISSGGLLSASSGAISFNATFDKIGRYTIAVVSPTGVVSNTLVVQVN